MKIWKNNGSYELLTTVASKYSSILRPWLRHNQTTTTATTGILLDEEINHGKLARPIHIVQELTQIKAIVIGRISFGVIRRCNGAHFVPVHGVITKEALDLFRYYCRSQIIPKKAQFAVPEVKCEYKPKQYVSD